MDSAPLGSGDSSVADLAPIEQGEGLILLTCLGELSIGDHTAQPQLVVQQELATA